MITFFKVLVKSKCIMLHCRKFPPKHLFPQKNIFLKTTKSNQKSDHTLVQFDNQGVETGFSQTNQHFSLCIVVVKYNFAVIKIIFLISHLNFTLN